MAFAPSLPRAMVMSGSSCFDAFQSELDYLFRTLRRLGVRPADLEDHAHEVFLVLDRKWSSFDRSRPLRPYLFGIAYRVVAASRRRGKREELSDIEEMPDGRVQLDDAVDASRARRLVLRALEKIPLERRAVFVMHDIDEISMRDITASLSIPLFTGYSRLRKARKEFEIAIRAIRATKQGKVEP